MLSYEEIVFAKSPEEGCLVEVAALYLDPETIL
jgi:hypothetical protein